jgi:hypothetical protein
VVTFHAFHDFHIHLAPCFPAGGDSDAGNFSNVTPPSMPALGATANKTSHLTSGSGKFIFGIHILFRFLSRMR